MRIDITIVPMGRHEPDIEHLIVLLYADEDEELIGNYQLLGNEDKESSE